MARAVPGAGTVLVSARGYALYIFAPYHRRQVTCTGGRAKGWPPVMLPSGAVPAAGPGVNASLLGSDPDPGDGRVVTYRGWPPYTYEDDARAGRRPGDRQRRRRLVRAAPVRRAADPRTAALSRRRPSQALLASAGLANACR